MHTRQLLSCAVGLAFLFAFSVSSSLLAQVERSIGEQDLCDENTAASTTIRITGDSAGNDGDLLTICETLTPGLRTGALEILEIDVDAPAGATVEVTRIASPGSTLGVFEDRRTFVDVDPHGPLPPAAENFTVHHGGPSYTSVATTEGRDLWTGGDTFEFAFTRIDGTRTRANSPARTAWRPAS